MVGVGRDGKSPGSQQAENPGDQTFFYCSNRHKNTSLEDRILADRRLKSWLSAVCFRKPNDGDTVIIAQLTRSSSD